MRQWWGIAAAGAVFLAAIVPAEARGGGGFRGGGGRVFARPAVPAVAARVGEAPRQARGFGHGFGRPFRFGQNGWAFASGYGYGLPWGDSGYDPAANPGEPDAQPEGLPPPPPWLYGYGPVPHHACFKPRLITIGRAPPKSHLPRVVYGSPLPGDCKGV